MAIARKGLSLTSVKPRRTIANINEHSNANSMLTVLRQRLPRAATYHEKFVEQIGFVQTVSQSLSFPAIATIILSLSWWQRDVAQVQNMEKKQPRLVALKKALAYSSLGKTKMYQLIHKGKIKAYKDGHLTLIDLDSIDNYRASLKPLRWRK